MTIDPRFGVLGTCAALLAFAAAVATPRGAAAQTSGKVTLCHIPPGNPSNAHTITVGVSALPAHLGHGDPLLPCDTCDQVGAICGGSNGACCGGTICNPAGVCEVPMCMPEGGNCVPAAPNCCSGLTCNSMSFCEGPPPPPPA